MYIEPKVALKLSTLFIQLTEQKASLDAPVNATLTELSDAAKRIGLEWFNRARFEQAAFYLTFPALNGDGDAQYAMATSTARLYGSTRYPFEETKKWLRLAAAKNNIFALMWLGDRESLAKATELSMAAVAAGNTQGMLNMYTLTEDITWLKKAADLGDPKAQFKLADAYRQHPGLMPNAVELAAVIEELCQKAADAGYSLALSDRVFSRTSTASMAEKQHRLAQLALVGDQEGLLEYGYALAGMPRNKTTPARTYGFEKDLPKACAVLRFVIPRMEGFDPVSGAEDDINEISHQMSPKQHDACAVILLELKSKIPSALPPREPLIVLGYGN